MTEKTYGRKTVRQKTYEKKILQLLLLFFVIGIVVGVIVHAVTSKPKEFTYGTVDEEIFMEDVELEYQTALETEFVPLNIEMNFELQQFIYYLSHECNIDYAFVMGLIQTESNFTPDIVSATDDYGLMQINKINHEWLSEKFGITDFLDPYQNAKAGIYILRELFEKYEEPSKVLMAYNLGESGAKQLWLQGITQTDYSVKVLKNAEKITAYLEGEKND